MPLSRRSSDPALRQAAACVLLAGLLFAAYFPCLHGTLVWDDDAWTKDIAHLTGDWHGLWRIWTEPTAMQQYYPVTGTTFWLDQSLWGDSTLPRHLENLLLHALGAFLLWRLLRRLAVPGAALTSSVFLLHPVMVESVAWITQRKNVLSLVFLLGALLAWERWRGKGEGTPESNHNRTMPARLAPAILCLLLFAAALLSKITAFVFAPTLLLIAWWKAGRLGWREHVLPTLPFFAVTLGLGTLVWWIEVHHVGAAGKDFSTPLAERLVNAGHAFWFYPRKLLWPNELCFVYPDWRTTPPGIWQWAWPAGALLAVAGLWLARRKTGRGPLAAVLFYAGALLPVTGLINVYGGLFSPVWDHWVHVPGLGILVLAGAGITLLAEKAGRPWAINVLAILLLPLLAWQSGRQSWQYSDKETLWAETLRRNPDAWLAHQNLGMERISQHQMQDAVVHFEAVLAIRPDHAEAWNNLGGALARLGRVDEAQNAYRKAIPLDERNAPYARVNLGNILLTHGRADDAIEQFRAALLLKPGYEEAHNSLGAALVSKGLMDEGMEHLREAVRIRPDYAQAYNNLGSALRRQDAAKAVEYYREALRVDPLFIDAHYNLGETLYAQDDVPGAIACYQRIMELDPGHERACNNLGLCFTAQGNMREAEAAYEKAIAIKPGYAAAHNNLANNLLRENRVREAMDHFQKAIEAEPQQLAALNNAAWVLATSTDAGMRDGPKAVDFARRAAELTNHEHPMVLATLAAALAETGAFAEAVQQARNALDLARRQNQPNLVVSLENYLRQYEAGQPWRVQRGSK